MDIFAKLQEKKHFRTVTALSLIAHQAFTNCHVHSGLRDRGDSLMMVAFSGLFRELMMTKPKPSFSLR